MLKQGKIVIAVDGPAGSGKGLLCRKLQNKYNLAHLDTGLLYRAVAYKLHEAGYQPEDEDMAVEMAEAILLQDTKNKNLRDETLANMASIVSGYPDVRKALLDFQRNFAKNPPEGKKGAVLDGRDIGTVVYPEADFKIYLTASLEARAERRFKELQERKIECIYDSILEGIAKRDRRDQERVEAPMVPADDAIIIDTSSLDPDRVLSKVISVVELLQPSK